jgi:hypothetical protein
VVLIGFDSSDFMHLDAGFTTENRLETLLEFQEAFVALDPYTAVRAVSAESS